MPSAAGPIHNAPWPQARQLAHSSVTVARPSQVPLTAALGSVLAHPLLTLTDLPAFDTVAMDGWAVRGTGPWVVVDRILAGGHSVVLSDGEAAEVATGAWFPESADSVLRREHGRLSGTDLYGLETAGTTSYRKDVRAQGEEAAAGDQVLAAGAIVTPPVLGLAAAAGHDTLMVRPVVVVDVLVMGDELIESGTSGRGKLRDSISPQVAGWLASCGARLGAIRSVPDDRTAAVQAVTASTADLVMTTGGTARGPVDQLHPALEEMGASVMIDQVAIRPGHPTVLARLRDERVLLGLPGNPLAAAVAFLSLGAPLIAGARGLPLTQPTVMQLDGQITAPSDAHRLMPARIDGDVVRPLPHHGPAMLSGLADANGLAVAAPGGAGSGDLVEVLRLPWAFPVPGA